MILEGLGEGIMGVQSTITCTEWFLRFFILDLFENSVGTRTSLSKNMDFLMKSTFFTVFKRKLSET